jgi:NhaP-type Na+/H+ or K+/H+ antiporter
MDIDWAALSSVFGVSLGVSVGLVALFTLGIAGLSRRERAVAQGSGSGALAVTGAYVCFAACAAAGAYGIYLIVA